MMEKILILILPTLFLAAFITRNKLVKSKTKQRIRASDPLLVITVILSNLCIFTAILSTLSDQWYQRMGHIQFLRNPWISYLGLILFTVSFLSGWFISAQLKDSWRIGVDDTQKTDLIQNGMYAYIRNPYFLSYFIGFFSLFLVRPSIVTAASTAATVAAFHVMVLKEEAHLLKIHGTSYREYKKRTGRYFPRRRENLH